MTTLAYTDLGSGTSLLFVHGHPFNRSMWQPQLDFFRDRYRVVAPDLRGYGASPVVPGIALLDDHAADLAELLDTLEIDSVVLIGLSMAGQIALECYRQMPHRIRALVLADTSAPAETPAGKEARQAMAARLEREGMSGYADEVLPRMLHPDNIAAMPDVARDVRVMMASTSPAGAAASLLGRAQRRDYVELLGRIDVPTLIVVGEHDEFTPISDAELMHSRIRGSELAIVPGAAHLPNLERPILFNSLLADFLDRAAR